METKTTLAVKKAIKEIIGIDINENKRNREIVEARAIYYKILREIDKNRTLKSIGETVGKDHATVLHSLKHYDAFVQHNKSMSLYKDEILRKLNFEPLKDYSTTKDDIIHKQKLEILLLKYEIQLLKEKEVRSDYNIIARLEQLLNDLEGQEQQETLIERLQAFYNVNKNLKTYKKHYEQY